VETEYALLARARQLDESALAEIHDRYYTAIYRYVAMKIGDRVLAEDLTSDVFMRLLSALRDRTAPQKSLRGWLYAVASRVVADHFRRRYRREETQLPDTLASQAPGPFQQTAQTLEWETLYEAIGGLTPDQQEVIALRFGQGMSIKEVADLLDKSEGAVKQLQARAVAPLARLLEETP
jgi:RNA polymerase sigma-70 factor (ECF subfamily)